MSSISDPLRRWRVGDRNRCAEGGYDSEDEERWCNITGNIADRFVDDSARISHSPRDVHAIERELTVDGLVIRYQPTLDDRRMFLPCSFWLVDNLLLSDAWRKRAGCTNG